MYSTRDTRALAWELINYCKEIEHLKGARLDVKYLKRYRSIKQNNTLRNHIHNGDAKLTENLNSNGTPGPSGAIVTGYHNLNKVVPPPPGPGQISFRGIVIPNQQGYFMGFIERNMADKIDPATGEPWKVFGTGTGPSNPANHISKKKHKNVFWPEEYTTQRIDEEMAFAYNNMDLTTEHKINTDKFGKDTYVYDGKATDGHTIEIMFYGGKHNSGDLVSIYPQYFEY